MFGNKSSKEAIESLEEEVIAKNREISRLKADHEIDVDKINATHEIDLKEKEFTIKHNTDEKIKELEKAIVKLEKENAVLQSEKTALEKLVDIDSDVISVKDLIDALMKKLPTVNIEANLGLTTTSTKNENKPTK